MNEAPALYDQTNELQLKCADKLFAQIKQDYVKSNVSTPKIVLDVGCGTGNVTVSFFKTFPETNRLIAFDLSQAMIDYAQTNYASDHKPVTFLKANIEDDFDLLCKSLKLTENSVDLCFSVYVLHWVRQRSKAMQNIYRLLKPGGRFYGILFAYSHTLAVQERMIQLPEWRQFFTPDKLQVPIELVDPELLQQNEPSTDIRTAARLRILKEFQKKVGDQRCTATFTLSKKPLPEELETYWHALCIKGGWPVDAMQTKYNYYQHRYAHSDHMLRANTSLCHYVAFLPKTLHDLYLQAYREYMDTEYCRQQTTYPVVYMTCDYIQLVGQK